MAEENANDQTKNEAEAAKSKAEEKSAENTANGSEKIVESLGKTLSELKASIAQKIEGRAAAETKEEEKAEKEQPAADLSSKISQLETQLQAAELQLEALRSGLKMQYLEDAVILASAKKRQGSESKTVFAELRSKYPAWFENTESTQGAQKGTGAAVKAGTMSQKVDGIGARLAKQQKTKITKSFWKN